LIRSFKWLIALLSGAVLVAALGIPASAEATPRPIPFAGSDTIFGITGQLASIFNGNGTLNAGTHVYNIPPLLTGTQTYTVPASDSCPTTTYNSTTNKPPNGSSAGISALVADTKGCFEGARSSRSAKPTDPSSLNFYAFAIDGVSWAHLSTGGHAPSNLSQAQLQGIYLCTQGTAPNATPKYTNWNQVGGSTAPIIRFLPQTGSGTLSFFETKILGLSSAQQGVLDDSNCHTKPIRIEENTGTAVPSVDRPYAILPYSFADWTAQKNGVVPDVRGGFILGAINTHFASVSTLGLGCNPCFLGRRYVYEVLKTTNVGFADALRFAGVTTSGNGYICSNDSTKIAWISKYGFVNLPFAPAGTGLPNSRCRKNPTPI
jgi:phosphate transport system substrate-binding protein